MRFRELLREEDDHTDIFTTEDLWDYIDNHSNKTDSVGYGRDDFENTFDQLEMNLQGKEDDFHRFTAPGTPFDKIIEQINWFVAGYYEVKGLKVTDVKVIQGILYFYVKEASAPKILEMVTFSVLLDLIDDQPEGPGAARERAIIKREMEKIFARYIFNPRFDNDKVKYTAYIKEGHLKLNILFLKKNIKAKIIKIDPYGADGANQIPGFDVEVWE